MFLQWETSFLLSFSLTFLQAIHGYKETERLRWEPACEDILSRVRSVAFPAGSPLLGPAHILDLDKTGYIKPHVDSVKVGYCCWSWHVLVCTISR